jgi:putative PIN family toxin of toxin-antitoxin system
VEKNLKKVVFDTNILISAFVFPEGTVRELINLSIKRKISIYVSNSIILEYCKVLDSKFNWTEEEIKENIKFISKITEIIDTDIKIDIIKEDEDDNKIIECAVAADVDAIISGDKHLLNIKKYKNIPILKPADFLKKIL